MKSAGKARNNGLYRHIRTSKEIIRNLLNDSFIYLAKFINHPFSTPAPARRRLPVPLPPSCAAGTSGRAQRPSRSTYTYRQSTAFWPTDVPGASPGQAPRSSAPPPSDTGRRPAAPAAWLAGSPRTAADPGRGIYTCRQCIMSCFPPQKSLPFSVAGFGPNSGKFSISRRFANVKCEKHPNFSVSFRLFVFKWRNILASGRQRL